METTLEISSRSSAWFRRIREAITSHRNEIVLEGPKQIRDAIERGWKPLAVALSPDASIIATSAPLLRFSEPLFRSLSETVHPQGVIGLFERPVISPRTILSSGGLTVVLDGVQDPGNVGVIIRLAAAFEAAGVLLTEESADAFGPKAIRASASAILCVPTARTTRTSILELAAELHLPLFAADGSGDPIPPPANSALLVFGSEGSGVSDVLAAASTRIRIPTSGQVESLNVASAAAVLLEASYRGRAGS
ncbi:MAG TPA: RNA methyltransferase [Thermoanaerobaculia bacterium]|nr:RNA methyltransferase [Thermoanaerobaculia bacterium]